MLYRAYWRNISNINIVTIEKERTHGSYDSKHKNYWWYLWMQNSIVIGCCHHCRASYDVGRKVRWFKDARINMRIDLRDVPNTIIAYSSSHLQFFSRYFSGILITITIYIKVAKYLSFYKRTRLNMLISIQSKIRVILWVFVALSCIFFRKRIQFCKLFQLF